MNVEGRSMRDHPEVRMPRARGEVLVVDDDAGIREVLADALLLEGIPVVLVPGGAEALAALDQGLMPSVILLDLLMPGVSGERLLAILRQHPSARGAAIVAMSASPERLVRIDGPDAKLPKPFDLHTLLETIGRLARRNEATGLGLGIPLLDDDHVQQLELLGTLADALRPGHAPRESAGVLERLIDRTRTHFASEGELMRRHAVPESDRHVREHTTWIGELERRERGSASSSPRLTRDEVLAMRTSLEIHIATMDRDLARHLSGGGAS